MEATGLLADASPYDAGRSYSVVADVYAELGDIPKAIELYELATERMSSHPSRYLMETYEKLAALLEDDGRKDANGKRKLRPHARSCEGAVPDAPGPGPGDVAQRIGGRHAEHDQP